jgi:hypothetical protein
MKKYICSISEFHDITNRISEELKYRMRIETTPEGKINQPDEKQYRKTYEIIISCHDIMKVCWHAREQIISDNDFEQVLCIHGLEYFKREFEKGNLSESSTVNLSTKYENRNGVLDCPYDPNKIQCYQNLKFQIEIATRIGFR